MMTRSSRTGEKAGGYRTAGGKDDAWAGAIEQKMRNICIYLYLSFFVLLAISGCGDDDTYREPHQCPVPTLSSPPIEATNVSLPPTLSWNPTSGAVSYALQVSTTSFFTSFAYNQTGLTDTIQQISELSNSTQYYWRANATDDYGTSGWSNVWWFTTESGVPPAPTLSSPSNGATNVALPPTLSWNSSSGADSYTLEVSTDSLFASFVHNQSGLTDTSLQISGLSNSTQYYWRASATNSYDTSGWSSVWCFTTESGSAGGEPCPGIPTVTYLGKTYNTVLIGTQCWLKENLDVGTMIQGSQNASNNGTIEKYCLDDDPANCITYGGLYQWNEAMQYNTTPGVQGICPPGWHIPTLSEFETLVATVINDGNALKAIGQGSASGGAGTNTSGFSALLSGERMFYIFQGEGFDTFFWSSTEYDNNNAYYLNLRYPDSNINLNYQNKNLGFCVRCVMD